MTILFASMDVLIKILVTMCGLTMSIFAQYRSFDKVK